MQTTDSSNFFRTEAELAKDDYRKEKAERTKDLGEPIELPGKIISFKIRDNDAWTAESGHVVRRVSLENGKTLQLYKGHTGPVTCLAFHEPDTLFTGSWDTTIKTWSIAERKLLSTTSAHGDFLKSLLVVPSLSLLISGSSDKAVRFWDLTADRSQPLRQVGSLSAHSRPVAALGFEPRNETSGTLYTADTMGLMKVWKLERDYGASARVRGTLQAELKNHRTGVNDLWVGKGSVWSASSDDTVLIQPSVAPAGNAGQKPHRSHSINHPNAVKAILPLSLTALEEPYLITAAGDTFRTYSYDVSSPDDPPDLLNDTDAHWHDVTALCLWMRVVEKDGIKQLEPWILSSSLDATLRRWRLTDLITPKPKQIIVQKPTPTALPKSNLTEEEERELAELMEDSD